MAPTPDWKGPVSKIASMQFLTMIFPLENSPVFLLTNNAPSMALLVLQKKAGTLESGEYQRFARTVGTGTVKLGLPSKRTKQNRRFLSVSY